MTTKNVVALPQLLTLYSHLTKIENQEIIMLICFLLSSCFSWFKKGWIAHLFFFSKHESTSTYLSYVSEYSCHIIFLTFIVSDMIFLETIKINESQKILCKVELIENRLELNLDENN